MEPKPLYLLSISTLSIFLGLIGQLNSARLYYPPGPYFHHHHSHTLPDLQEEVKNPCRLSRLRKLPKNLPSIRLVDDRSDDPSEDVILGHGGISDYLLPQGTPPDVVIECSGSSPLKWEYSGQGLHTSLKVVETKWSLPGSGSNYLRTNCHSAAIVITNVTDQLTGQYTCAFSDSGESNSFWLFVPHSSPFYHPEAETLNISIEQHWTGPPDPVVIPCISRKRLGAGISLYLINNDKDNVDKEKKMDLGPGLRYDPFQGFILTPKRSLFSKGVAKFVCRFDKDTKKYKDLKDRVLLEVNLSLKSDEKIAPETPTVSAFSPYFSWTTRQRPKIDFLLRNSSNINSKLSKRNLKRIKSNAVVWQQFFTENDYEEVDPSAKVYHLGSLHLLNLTKGTVGTISLVEDFENLLIYQWDYKIFDKMNEPLVGLSMSYDPSEGLHVFTCISATESTPKLTLKPLFTDFDELVDTNSSFSLLPCDMDIELGCLVLSTPVAQAEVSCLGDGIHRTIRYPEGFVEPSRPYFISRGDTIPLKIDVERTSSLTLPCRINAPLEEMANAIFLFKKNANGEYTLLHNGDNRRGPSGSGEVSKAQEGVDFYPKQGFRLDTTQFEDIGGEYLCSSSEDVEDRSDAVVIVVSPKDTGTLISPEDRSDTVDLDILDLEINREDEDVVEIVCRSRNSADSVSNLSSSDQKPTLNYFLCPNPSSCDLMQRCGQKNCNPETRTGSHCGESCSRILLKSVPINGYLKAVCQFNGLTKEEMISDVFFREDIHWTTEEDSDLLYLYIGPSSDQGASTDQNPQREIRPIGSNLEWEIGDTVTFSCAAAPHLYANGVKWALQTKDGALVYQKDNIYDAQFKYSSTQILSSFTVTIDTFDLSRIWCFIPTLSNPVEWRNVSQPIFVKNEIDENCNELEPSIRLLNIYPPASRSLLDLSIDSGDSIRLDKLPYFIVPNGTLQFAIKVTSNEPVDWSFSTFGSGPKRTPLIQSDRQITNFYDQSTYCYTSRLLINLRHSPDIPDFSDYSDTGRYTALFKNHVENSLSFYLFVPSNQPPFLLHPNSNNTEVNETWKELDKPYNLPCLLNNPGLSGNLKLFRKLSTVLTDSEFVEVDIFKNEYIKYDLTKGYVFQPNPQDLEHLLGAWKCALGQDYLVFNVFPQERKKAELKYERVGHIHIFTCTSSTDQKPLLEFTEFVNSTYQHKLIIEDDPDLEKSDLEKSSDSFTFKRKECPQGCTILMTTAPSGKVHCIGDGIDESLKYPPSSDNQNNVARLDISKKTGLSYDPLRNVFKCQTNSLLPPELVAVTCRRPNECQLMHTLLRGKGDRSQSEYRECGEGCAELEVRSGHKKWGQGPNWFSVFLRCKGDDNLEIFSQYFRHRNETVLVTLDTVSKFRQIRLDVVDFRRTRNGVDAKFRCFANRYFYSRGFQWALEKLDGTLVFQEHIPAEIEVQNFSSTMSEIRLGIDESVYKGVWCFVPLLDSSKWANATISTPIDKLVYTL